MLTWIVGHKHGDLDAYTSMAAVWTYLRKVCGEPPSPGSIRFAFIPKGTTFDGVEVSPENLYEVLPNGDRVWHVDCGGGMFDDHLSGCEQMSSLGTVAEALDFATCLPHWGNVVGAINLADQGKLPGILTIQQAIRGWHKLNQNHENALYDHIILEMVWDFIDGILAEELAKSNALANEPPTLQTIAEKLGLGEKTPYWRGLSRYLELADSGENLGSLSLPQALRGWYRLGLEKEEILWRVNTFFRAMLANVRTKAEAGRIKYQKVDTLFPLPTTEKPWVVVEELGEFGRLGIAVTSASIWAQVRGRARCEVTVMQDPTTGNTGIFSGDCLRKLGIVQAIRTAEARKRDLTLTEEELGQKGHTPGMSWFAFQPNGHGGKVISLLHGSPKAVMPKGHETRLSLEEIARIVEQCCANF